LNKGLFSSPDPYISIFDWIENTLEILFINNHIEFSNTLFFIHSIIASLKWLALPIIVTFIIKLSLQDNANESV
jgi:hypothetical protein